MVLVLSQGNQRAVWAGCTHSHGVWLWGGWLEVDLRRTGKGRGGGVVACLVAHIILFLTRSLVGACAWPVPPGHWGRVGEVGRGPACL